MANKPKPMFQVAATYEGGHPLEPNKQRGELMVWPDRLEHATRKGSMTVPLSDISGCELRPMQFGLMRSAVGGENRALQAQTPMAFIACTMNGFPCELRFHIHGALTIPGESKKAQEFRDALNAAKFHSARSSAAPTPASPLAQSPGTAPSPLATYVPSPNAPPPFVGGPPTSNGPAPALAGLPPAAVDEAEARRQRLHSVEGRIARLEELLYQYRDPNRQDPAADPLVAEMVFTIRLALQDLYRLHSPVPSTPPQHG